VKYKAYPSYKDSGDSWLGNLPEQWSFTRLKSILKERGETNKPIKTNNILSCSILFQLKGDKRCAVINLNDADSADSGEFILSVGLFECGSFRG